MVVQRKNNPAAVGQQEELRKLDELKEKLVGTDRTDHWEELLDLEKEIKKELLKKDLTKHKGMQLFIDWMIKRVREINELLTLAKSDQLTTSQRDGLIEVRDFAIACVKFLDPKGNRLKEINKELDFQLEGEEDEAENALADSTRE